MRKSLDPQDRECLNRLRQSDGASVRDLCEIFGVTPTAIRQRASRLLQRGLVRRDVVRRPSRGRPQYIYRVTERGFRELGDNYGDLARILWRALKQIDDPTIRAGVMACVKRSLVDHYGQWVGTGTTAERFANLSSALADDGYDVELDERNGLPILRERNCPYPELATSDPEICSLEQEVLSEVLGTDLGLIQCWRDGKSCCEFEPLSGPVRELQT
ncbi:MAG: MarR family transcriptional regulator [Planctomycetaceae bacterium]|nr:MarR family transcriptional regulator [Planctomycetaceae bacterium]